MIAARSAMQVIAAFDMRVPAQRQALASLLAKSPVEQAQARLFAAGKKVDWYITQHLTVSQQMAFCHAYEVPADLPLPKAVRLAELVALQRAAMADLNSAKTAEIEAQLASIRLEAA